MLIPIFFGSTPSFQCHKETLHATHLGTNSGRSWFSGLGRPGRVSARGLLERWGHRGEEMSLGLGSRVQLWPSKIDVLCKSTHFWSFLVNITITSPNITMFLGIWPIPMVAPTFTRGPWASSPSRSRCRSHLPQACGIARISVLSHSYWKWP